MIVCVATPRLLVEYVAVLDPLRLAVASETPPSRKVTVPVGAHLLFEMLVTVTVAVNVTLLPKIDGPAGEAVTVVEVVC